MRTTLGDPWTSASRGNDHHYSDKRENAEPSDTCLNDRFEDSFVSPPPADGPATIQLAEDLPKLPDSEQYLARLNSRLKAIKGGTSKRDLINSLSVAKEDCIARLITAGENLEKPEERELAANPIIRHIAPHLQALTANELVHLLKADALQVAVNEQNNQSIDSEESESKSTDSQPDSQIQDSNGL